MVLIVTFAWNFSAFGCVLAVILSINAMASWFLTLSSVYPTSPVSPVTKPLATPYGMLNLAWRPVCGTRTSAVFRAISDVMISIDSIS